MAVHSKTQLACDFYVFPAVVDEEGFPRQDSCMGEHVVKTFRFWFAVTDLARVENAVEIPTFEIRR